MALTKYRLAQLRERLREEAGVLDAASVRLKDLCLSIPAPDLEELRAPEAGTSRCRSRRYGSVFNSRSMSSADSLPEQRPGWRVFRACSSSANSIFSVSSAIPLNRRAVGLNPTVFPLNGMPIGSRSMGVGSAPGDRTGVRYCCDRSSSASLS